MEAFSYFKPPPLDLGSISAEDEDEPPAQERGEVVFALHCKKG